MKIAERRRQEKLGTKRNSDVASSNSVLSPSTVAHYRCLTSIFRKRRVKWTRVDGGDAEVTTVHPVVFYPALLNYFETEKSP